MEAEKNTGISERFQGEEPEIFAVDHAADFDSYHDRLQEAEADYREACAAFLAENPGTEAIMEAAEDAERAARELYSRVQVIFLMKESSDEDRAHGLRKSIWTSRVWNRRSWCSTRSITTSSSRRTSAAKT